MFEKGSETLIHVLLLSRLVNIWGRRAVFPSSPSLITFFVSVRVRSCCDAYTFVDLQGEKSRVISKTTARLSQNNLFVSSLNTDILGF